MLPKTSAQYIILKTKKIAMPIISKSESINMNFLNIGQTIAQLKLPAKKMTCKFFIGESINNPVWTKKRSGSDKIKIVKNLMAAVFIF